MRDSFSFPFTLAQISLFHRQMGQTPGFGYGEEPATKS